MASIKRAAAAIAAASVFITRVAGSAVIEILKLAAFSAAGL